MFLDWMWGALPSWILLLLLLLLLLLFPLLGLGAKHTPTVHNAALRGLMDSNILRRNGRNIRDITAGASETAHDRVAYQLADSKKLVM